MIPASRQLIYCALVPVCLPARLGVNLSLEVLMQKFCPLVIVILLLLLGGVAHALEVGDAAPSFSAKSNLGPIELPGLLAQGPVILSFYYADFSGLKEDVARFSTGSVPI